MSSSLQLTNSSTLDLSRRDLAEVPLQISTCKDLENLYLEGNKLKSLPDSLFLNLSNLKWLDLRNNQIEALPPSIEKLRSLRTLLLEGNQLVSLPAQLCRLSSLTGLNICRNPLQDPPKEITERGTKAVLEYLREKLNDEDMYLSDSSSSLPDSGEGSTTYYIPLKLSKSAPSKRKSKAQNASLPTPEMKPATLHSQDTPSKPLSSKPRPPPRKKKQNKAENVTMVLAKTQSNKADINKSLEKLKSKQGLEEWRTQAKLKQKLKEEEVMQSGEVTAYVKAAETAPFATEVFATLEPTEAKERKEESREDRVQKHTAKLREERNQVGIITNPSAQLQQAEKALAEALAMQEELGRQRSTEYRLKAFTGDLPY